MSNEKPRTVTIQKGKEFNLVVSRDHLISADQTPDGIVFKFKNGLDLMCSHQQMPLQVKELITSTVMSFEKGSLLINLFDYVKPVKVIL